MKDLDELLDEFDEIRSEFENAIPALRFKGAELTKEWLEQKAQYEAEIEALKEKIALMLDEGKGRGIHLIEVVPGKIIVPGQSQQSGLKIVNVGFNCHQAMHALIQAMGVCHSDMMMQQAKMAQAPPMEGLRLVN